MVEIGDQQLLTISEGRAHLSKSMRRPPSLSAFWRWCIKPNKHGSILDSIVIGGTRYTTVEAMDEYFRACTAAANGETPTNAEPKTKTRIQRERERRECDRRLDEEGN